VVVERKKQNSLFGGLLHRKRSPGLSLFSKREYGEAGRELFVGAGSARPGKDIIFERIRKLKTKQ